VSEIAGCAADGTREETEEVAALAHHPHRITAAAYDTVASTLPEDAALWPVQRQGGILDV
jgi:hypothetical protein